VEYRLRTVIFLEESNGYPVPVPHLPLFPGPRNSCVVSSKMKGVIYIFADEKSTEN
jgi:hypothetical protein